MQEGIYKKNFLKSCIYSTAQAYINVFIAYDTKWQPRFVAETAHSLEQELNAHGVVVPYASLVEWLNARLTGPYRDPSANATITVAGEWVNYSADGCSGGVKRNEAILRMF